MTRKASSKERIKKKRTTRLSIETTRRAKKILAQAKDCTKGLLDTLDTVRAGARGALTDEQQDLLRAALVFSAAGLDSALKELMKRAIPALAMVDPSVRSQLSKYAARKLRDEQVGQPESAAGYRFLADILSFPMPIRKLTERYVDYLTGSSLQSASELEKAARALGVEPKAVGIEVAELKPIFDARNKIIHEFDVDLDSPARRHQTPRTRDQMEAWSAQLLDIATDLVKAVEQKLATLER